RLCEHEHSWPRLSIWRLQREALWRFCARRLASQPPVDGQPWPSLGRGNSFCGEKVTASELRSTAKRARHLQRKRPISSGSRKESTRLSGDYERSGGTGQHQIHKKYELEKPAAPNRFCVPAFRRQ